MPASNSSSALRGSMPFPPEAFSQLAITKSTPASACRRAVTTAAARRPGLPTMSPRKSRRIRHSPGDVARSGLPDDGHLDLPRVGHLLLDLAGDVAGEERGLVVGHGARIDDDADLP